jgi:hypothetical protein
VCYPLRNSGLCAPEFIDANTAIGQLLVERDRSVDG